VPMYATYLLLRKLWQFDRKAKHGGFKNKYSLENNGKAFTLVPLFLRQVYEDKMKLKGEKRREKKKINHVKM